MRSSFTAWCLSLAIWGLAASTADATVFRMLTGDYTTINSDWSASESGWSFAPVTDGALAKPSISSAHYAGNYSIAIQVPTDESGQKQRVEYKIAGAADADGLHFDNARYSGFAFKLGAPVAAFESSTLFWQAWQGSPWGPPASLKFASDASAPYRLRLCIRNMSVGPDSAVPDIEVWSGSVIYPETWYAVVIYLSPRYNGAGNIKLWINGVKYADWTGNIGYDPSQVAGAYNGLDIKNGIYQPDANSGHTFYFDQIMFADSYGEAAAIPYTNSPPVAAAERVSALANTAVDVDLRTLASDAETPMAQWRFGVGSALDGTVAVRADGHTARFTPATNFLGTASFSYTVTDLGEDPQTLLHYSFEPPDDPADGYATDSSGGFHDGNLLAVGAGAFAYSTNVPLAGASLASLELTQSGTSGAARLTRTIGPTKFNLSDNDWTFAGWFQRVATTNHDFVFYMGSDNGFGGGGDELQLYCPSGSSTLRIQHYNTNNVLDADAASSGTAAAGQWHHAALVFQRTNANAGILRGYLDGVQFAATNVAWALQQSEPVVFGGHNSTTSSIDRWFNGRLDDLVLFKKALSPADVSCLTTQAVVQFGGLRATNTVGIIFTNYARPALSSFAVANSKRQGAGFTGIQAIHLIRDGSDFTSHA